MKSVIFETEKLPVESCTVIAITTEGLKQLRYKHSLGEFGEDVHQGSRDFSIWQKCNVMGWADIENFLVA